MLLMDISAYPGSSICKSSCKPSWPCASDVAAGLGALVTVAKWLSCALLQKGRARQAHCFSAPGSRASEPGREAQQAAWTRGLIRFGKGLCSSLCPICEQNRVRLATWDTVLQAVAIVELFELPDICKENLRCGLN